MINGAFKDELLKCNYSYASEQAFVMNADFAVLF
jgi:hypothetical protein